MSLHRVELGQLGASEVFAKARTVLVDNLIGLVVYKVADFERQS